MRRKSLVRSRPGRAVIVVSSLAITATTLLIGSPTAEGAVSTASPWVPISTPYNVFHIAASTLASVSCPPDAGRYCLAVGTETLSQADAPDQPLTELWTGTWKIISTPTVSSNSSRLVGVSCSSKTYCMAVGDSAPGGPWAQLWNGTSWTVTPPLASIPNGFTVQSVSCFSTDCVAVGVGGDIFDNNSNAAAEFWNGTSWASDSPTSLGEFSGVSCSSFGRCLGVGQLPPGTGATALADSFNGTWSPASPPNTPAFGGVDCVKAAETCMAVGGNYTYSSLTASVWDGSAQSWTPTTPILPSGFARPAFLGVSCPTTGLCVGVGTGLTGTRHATTPVIEAWNGSSWVLMNTTRVAPSGLTAGDEFNSVSCPSATFCMTVGWRQPLYTTNFEALPYSAYWGTLP